MRSLTLKLTLAFLFVGLIGALLVAMLAYAVAGPYLAINGIRNVVAKGEYGELVRFVDFEKLRDSVTPQVQQRIVGGIIGGLFGGSSDGKFQPAGWIMSIVGALILLWAYLNFFVGK